MNISTKFFISAVIVADLLAVVYFGGNLILTGTAFPEKQEAKVIVPGADQPVQAAAAETAAPAAPAKPFDLASYVADPVKGQQIAARCKACHDFSQNGPNRVGPNLWGVIGRKPGTHPGFSYSSAMVDEGNKIGAWDADHIFQFLESPGSYLPGTKMMFIGLQSPEDRANVIAWLKTLK